MLLSALTCQLYAPTPFIVNNLHATHIMLFSDWIIVGSASFLPWLSQVLQIPTQADPDPQPCPGEGRQLEHQVHIDEHGAPWQEGYARGHEPQAPAVHTHTYFVDISQSKETLFYIMTHALHTRTRRGNEQSQTRYDILFCVNRPCTLWQHHRILWLWNATDFTLAQ